jgi:hypothetical protein
MAVNKSTAVVKKKGDRGGVNPGGGNPGNLPYGAVTGGQPGADPVGLRAASQKKQRRAVGYGNK